MAETRHTPVKKVWFWRWRRNPLRRHSDTVEARIVLVTWTVALLGGLLAGEVAGAVVEDGLAARRAAVHPVSAVLVEDADKAPSVTSVGSDGTVRATVRWTAPDGSTHTAKTRVVAGSDAGTPVTVWSDRTGALVRTPPSATEALVESALTGVLVAVGTGGAVLGCGWVARHRLNRRRMRDWETEWATVGPEWRKRMTG
ncbi:hypothetical protein K4B79_29245 [Streptomyces lincolnensis]|uniref:Rv1733c family protein n=1 Tax=Streptomyces lincolnensis TaxID=1915 RepID=UPI001E467547|nr:hypothetical protein [Streptomyces lincolnensis]MCD7442294.1 hypothetical protein [Streptomyces lincolnensis]